MDENRNDYDQNVLKSDIVENGGQSEVNVLGLLPVIVLIAILFIRLIFILYKHSGQKTRSPQQRRGYMGSRPRASLTPQEPTIYVSPSNFPPPPKYEAMAPPSYEEVVGIHYPGYRPPVQPITTPITTAMAQNGTTEDTTSNTINNANNTTTSDDTNASPATVITVTAADTRTSVTVSRP